MHAPCPIVPHAERRCQADLSFLFWIRCRDQELPHNPVPCWRIHVANINFTGTARPGRVIVELDVTDILDPRRRSELMRRVRTRGTAPELAVRRLLHAKGYRFRLHPRELPGTPDIVLPRYRTAVFVHGCFWHGHENCGAAKRPQSNVDFWNTKIDGNVARDRRIARQLRKDGWRVIVVWECEVQHWTELPQKLRLRTT